jgi:methylase of polypeptide subunit release factors
VSEISTEIVKMAYRMFLGREPESDEVVRDKAKAVKTYCELRDLFVGCDEFQNLYPSVGSQISRNYWERPRQVEVDVSDGILTRLWERLREQWRRLGENEPYWSVLTDGNYLACNLDKDKIVSFYNTGFDSAALIDLFEERTGARVSRRVCLELGCGVGRVTAHLAARFDKVIAADISPGNLAICERRMKELGQTNVETRLLAGLDDLLTVGPIDFFFSIIVLQHNPPPIQKTMLGAVLRNMSPYAGCLFQTVDSLQQYSFSAEAYLATGPQIMDIHCLPKPIVLRLLSDHGLVIRDVQVDPWIGAFGSYTYFATCN